MGGEYSGPEMQSLVEAASHRLDLAVTGVSRCAGGDINLAFRLELEDGTSAFLKTRPGTGAADYADEAAGLEWLAEPAALRVPEVLAIVEGRSSAGLVLEWIEPGTSLSPVGEERLGRGLAALHSSGASAHGLPAPGSRPDQIRLGSARLPMTGPHGTEAGFDQIYATQIEDLASQALAVGHIEPEQASLISRLAGRIDRFSGPPVPPARLHGDLWGGNVMADRSGQPCLIDPAAYGGHPEVDLAMLELFAPPSEPFRRAYQEVAGLPTGREERVALWQVQPLLVHTVLFGGHYGAAAARAAAGYVST